VHAMHMMQHQRTAAFSNYVMICTRLLLTKGNYWSLVYSEFEII